MSTDTGYSNAGEYWVNGRRHSIGCHCGADGDHCEQVQAVAETAAERRAYPYDPEAGW
jgi:hypothetical protein